MTSGKPPVNPEHIAVNPLNFVRAETDRNMNLIRLKILSQDSKLPILSSIILYNELYQLIF